jgi:hypothetical protein
MFNTSARRTRFPWIGFANVLYTKKMGCNDLIAAINLVSPSVTNVIGGYNLARTHLNDSLSSLDRNAEATDKDAFENVDLQMLNSGRRKRFVLLYVE